MKALIITLVDQPARLANAQALQKTLVASGFEALIFPAWRYNGPEFAQIDFERSANMERRMTAGEIACSWSHYSACATLAAAGEGGFIMEDDAELLRPLESVLLPDPESGVELLSGSAWDPNGQRDGFHTLMTVWEKEYHITSGLPYGTQGYYVTAEGAKILAANLLPIRWASDVALDRLSKSGILDAALAIEPWAVQRGGIESYIGQR